YDYLGEDVSIVSRLDRESDRIRQSGERPDLVANPYYLLDVDNELVVPVDTKIRFVITADDVIHSWWVPALGWKQDAVPGIVNEAWTEIREPGVYRGQCAELCGKDHGFMPIVVRALPIPEYEQWLQAEKAKAAPVAAQAASAAAAPAAGRSNETKRQGSPWPPIPLPSPSTTTTTPTSRASSNAGSSPRTTRTSARCTCSSASRCSSSARR